MARSPDFQVIPQLSGEIIPQLDGEVSSVMLGCKYIISTG